MVRRIALLVMVLTLSLSAPVWAAEAASGKIEGQLVNKTAGGGSVAEQDVTLKTYLNDAEKNSVTTKTDTEGRFAFSSLATDPSYSYQITLTYQEAQYDGDQFTFNEGEVTKSVELAVYNSIASDEAIKIATAHTIIYVGQGSLEVIEVFSFSNESDRTYIGSGEITATGKRRTLRLPLPDKATELQYGGELMVCCVVPDKESFFDTMPVLPGSKEIAYSYRVSYSGGEYTYSRRVNYPMSGFNFLIQGESVEVASDQLVTEGPVEIEGSQFNNLSGGGFAPGDIMVAQLSGLPQVANRGIILWVVLLLIVLTASFSFLYLARKRGRPQPVRARDSLQERRERLLVELAQLDDSFEDGKIADEDYHRLRTARKAELVRLMQRPKESRGKR